MTLPVYTRTLPTVSTSLRWSQHRPRAHAQKSHAQVQAMTTIITFDVDGTLIRTVGTDSNRCSTWAWPAISHLLCRHCKKHVGCCRLHKAAFAHAWMKVFNLDTDIDILMHHGMTDPLILVSMLEHHGTSRQEVGLRQGLLDYGLVTEVASGVILAAASFVLCCLSSLGAWYLSTLQIRHDTMQRCARLQASCCQQLAFV